MAVKRLVDSLRRAVADLESAGATWAIVGGLAVSARTEPRTTRDVDFAVDDDADAESIARALMRLGYEIGAGIEQTDTGRLASLRLWPPGDRRRVVMIDLLFASSGIEAEIVSSAERLELVAGTTVPVATVAHLLAMKVLSRDDRRRPQDRVDLGALLHVATAEDIESARAALALVTHRGFARGRDLDSALTAAITELTDAEQRAAPRRRAEIARGAKTRRRILTAQCRAVQARHPATAARSAKRSPGSRCPGPSSTSCERPAPWRTRWRRARLGAVAPTTMRSSGSGSGPDRRRSTMRSPSCWMR